MTEADRYALRRLVGGGASPRATTDELQGLLLQVVFALLMIFMIAYFVFVENQKKERVEEVMALNRQKLTIALEKRAEDARIRYGLNALMTQGVDGRRTFEPDEYVKDGALMLASAAKDAFARGSAAAAIDYADGEALEREWQSDVIAEAGLKTEELGAEELEWLGGAVKREVENVRLDARGVQRALAARLVKEWVENPESLGNVEHASAIAEELKSRSLRKVAEATGAKILQ